MLSNTLGSYLVQAEVWDSESEMLAAFKKSVFGTIHISNHAYLEDHFYSLKIDSDEGGGGITLTTYKNGKLPTLIYDQKSLTLILGHGKSIYWIDIQGRNILMTLQLKDEFCQFHTLDHFDKGAFFLIQSEFEVLAYTYQGACVWTHRGKDIISGFQLTSSALHLDYMDGTRCTLDWVDGRQLL